MRAIYSHIILIIQLLLSGGSIQALYQGVDGLGFSTSDSPPQASNTSKNKNSNKGLGFRMTIVIMQGSGFRTSLGSHLVNGGVNWDNGEEHGNYYLGLGSSPNLRPFYGSL